MQQHNIQLNNKQLFLFIIAYIKACRLNHTALSSLASSRAVYKVYTLSCCAHFSITIAAMAQRNESNSSMKLCKGSKILDPDLDPNQKLIISKLPRQSSGKLE